MFFGSPMQNTAPGHKIDDDWSQSEAANASASFNVSELQYAKQKEQHKKDEHDNYAAIGQIESVELNKCVYTLTILWRLLSLASARL